jgi:hypothetical protein
VRWCQRDSIINFGAEEAQPEQYMLCHFGRIVGLCTEDAIRHGNARRGVESKGRCRDKRWLSDGLGDRLSDRVGADGATRGTKHTAGVRARSKGRAGTCKLAGHWPARGLERGHDRVRASLYLATLYSPIPLSPCLLSLTHPQPNNPSATSCLESVSGPAPVSSSACSDSIFLPRAMLTFNDV